MVLMMWEIGKRVSQTGECRRLCILESVNKHLRLLVNAPHQARARHRASHDKSVLITISQYYTSQSTLRLHCFLSNDEELMAHKLSPRHK